MSSLTGSSISGTYDQLLALPPGGGNAASPTTLLALTDGNAEVTFALKLASDRISIGAGDKFFFDGGTHTYIRETSDDLLEFWVGNQKMLYMDEGNDVVHFESASVQFDNTNSDSPFLYIQSDPGNNLHHVALAGTGHNTDTLRIGRSDGGTIELRGSAINVGASGGSAGHDVTFYGATNGEYCRWDESRDDFVLTSGCNIGLGDTTPAYPLVLQVAGRDCIATFISEDDDSLLYLTGGTTAKTSQLVFKCHTDDSRGLIYYDHHGTPASQKMVFNVGDNSGVTAMTILGDGKIGVGTISPNTTLHVSGSFAVSGPSESPVTFAAVDDSPSVATGNLFISGSSTETINSFDDGTIGQIITIYSNAAITYSHDAGNLSCGTHDIVTAAGDITRWVKYSTNWHIISWIDHSENLSGAGGF